MSGGYKDPQQNREYMRNYMRRYRAKAEAGCAVCGKELRGRQGIYCGRKCRQHAYHKRHAERNRARYRAWHAANRERSTERVRQWRLANPGRNIAYVRKWRQKPCPYCEGSLVWPAKSCKRCAIQFGCICHDNPSCGIPESHKHCPCGMPVYTKRGHYHVEACEFCARELKRLSLTLPLLFELGRRHDKEFEEAA